MPEVAVRSLPERETEPLFTEYVTAPALAELALRVNGVPYVAVAELENVTLGVALAKVIVWVWVAAT